MGRRPLFLCVAAVQMVARSRQSPIAAFQPRERYRLHRWPPDHRDSPAPILLFSLFLGVRMGSASFPHFLLLHCMLVFSVAPLNHVSPVTRSRSGGYSGVKVELSVEISFEGYPVTASIDSLLPGDRPHPRGRGCARARPLPQHGLLPLPPQSHVRKGCTPRARDEGQKMARQRGGGSWLQ